MIAVSPVFWDPEHGVCRDAMGPHDLDDPGHILGGRHDFMAPDRDIPAGIGTEGFRVDLAEIIVI